MKNLIKLKVILLVFFIIFTSESIAADRILPIAKPIVDQQTKIETLNQSSGSKETRVYATSIGWR